VKQSLERLAMTETTFLVQAHLYLALIFPLILSGLFSQASSWEKRSCLKRFFIEKKYIFTIIIIGYSND
jgi:hypothetical protein